jgi:hypothetical protein
MRPLADAPTGRTDAVLRVARVSTGPDSVAQVTTDATNTPPTAAGLDDDLHRELVYLLSLLDKADLSRFGVVVPAKRDMWWHQHLGDDEMVQLMLVPPQDRWIAIMQARAAVGVPGPATSREAVLRLSKYVVLVVNTATGDDLLIGLGNLLPSARNIWQGELVRIAFRLVWELQ